MAFVPLFKTSMHIRIHKSHALGGPCQRAGGAAAAAEPPPRWSAVASGLEGIGIVVFNLSKQTQVDRVGVWGWEGRS